MVEAGPRHFEQDVNTWNVTASLNGTIHPFGREWFWDANFVSSKNTADQAFTGDINVSRVALALGPLANCTGDCVPLNLFGGEGSITPAMLDYIVYTESNTSEQTLRDFSFNVTGDLFDMPAGPLAFAAGYEHRYNEGRFDPDPITAAGNSSDIPSLPSAGHFDVNEVYGELRVPLASDDPFFYLLEASLAGRYFDYSTFGSDATYKAGLRWRPVEEVLLRASYAEGFRAPTIGEFAGSASRFDQVVLDPCNDLLGQVPAPPDDFGRGVGNPAPANVFDNCVAHGVPADGSYTQLNAQLPVFTFGNPDLQPETSESWNIGFVWRPGFLAKTPASDDVTIEINYADIKIDNAIQAQDSAAIMGLCANTGDQAACDTITRAVTGAVRAITNPLINVGNIETRAVDVNFSWTSPEWSIGRFTLLSSTSRLLEFTEVVDLGAVISREGTERGSPSQGFPETKSTLTLGWDLGGFGALVTGRYISSLLESDGNVMDSLTLWDGQVHWTPSFWDEHMTFALGVNNLFDEQIPGCVTCSVNSYDPSTYDVPGRFGYIRIAYAP
jgi:iron complex outermembrane receptor protein